MNIFRYVFNIYGTVSRIEYFLFILSSYFMLIFIVLIIVPLFPSQESEEIFFVFINLFWLITLFFFSIKRTRDFCFNPWRMLILFLPLANIIFLLELFFAPGLSRLRGILNLLNALQLLAESDGKITLEECLIFRRFVEENVDDTDLVNALSDRFERGTLNPFRSYRYHLKQFIQKDPLSYDDKIVIMNLLTNMAGADGDINKIEQEYLGLAYEYLGLDKELPEGFDSLIGMLAKLAKADGHVTREEVEKVDTFFKSDMQLSNYQRDKAVKIFDREKKSITTFESHAERFYRMFQGTELIEDAFALLMQLALADEVIHENEKELLETAARIFRIEDFESSETETKSQFKDSDFHYAKTLGVSPNAPFEEIKKKYRRLVKINHPDTVAHLSDAIKKVAGDEMQKINEAYDYFKVRYENE